jgi:malonyl-CoA/methylmalonyl-CoA synthetase
VNAEKGHGVNAEKGHGVNAEKGHGVSAEEGHGVNAEEAHGVNAEEAHGVNAEEAHGVNAEEAHGASAPAWARHLPAGIRPGDVDLLAAGSLPGAWTRAWAADPARPVLHDPVAGWRTAEQLEAASRRMAGRLHAAGLRAGDRFVVSAEPSGALVDAYLGAVRLGLVVVPMNTAYRPREVAHVVTDAGVTGALVDDPERAAWVAEAAAGPVVVVGPEVDLPDGPDPVLDAAATDDPALICYTSGTTGTPKGAVLTHGNLLASAEAVRLAWRWSPDDRLVLALPLFHVHGLGVGLHGTLVAGASAVLLPRFDVDAVLDAAAAPGGTLFFGVPTMYQRLARSPRLGELGALRLCVSGSAPLPAALHATIAAGTGQHVLERYGMTETVMNVSNPHDGERRPGTVGFPFPGVEVRLDDGGDGSGPGEILLRGPNVTPGYWGRPEATAAAFDAEGWFRSGDIGEHDADGYLRIVGRAKELIISGGFNVYPREVEDVLRAHPAVADAAVVGTPSEEWGEAVTAFCVAEDRPCTDDELLAHAAAQLAPYKRPKRVHWVDALPRNALGKVLKDELRA